MNLEAIYQHLCLSGAPAADLARMEDAALAELVRHLERSGVNSGVPAIISGLAEREAARRFVEDQLGREGAVGEG